MIPPNTRHVLLLLLLFSIIENIKDTRSPQTGLALWILAHTKVSSPFVALARFEAIENNDSHRRFINIDAFYPPLITAAGRSIGRARCCHSNIFEPDVYKTLARIISFSTNSLF